MPCAVLSTVNELTLDTSLRLSTEYFKVVAAREVLMSRFKQYVK